MEITHLDPLQLPQILKKNKMTRALAPKLGFLSRNIYKNLVNDIVNKYKSDVIFIPWCMVDSSLAMQEFLNLRITVIRMQTCICHE